MTEDTIKAHLATASDAIRLAQSDASPAHLAAAAEAVRLAHAALGVDDADDDRHDDEDGSSQLEATVHQLLVGLIHNELVSWPSPLMRELVGDVAGDEALRLTLSRVLELLAANLTNNGAVVTSAATGAATATVLAPPAGAGAGAEAGFHSQSAMGRAFAQLPTATVLASHDERS